MRVDDIPNYIEEQKIYPPIKKGIYCRNEFGNIYNDVVYRYDITETIDKHFLNTHNYITHIEYDNKLMFDNDDDVQLLNESYNYYSTDNKIFDLEQALVDYIFKFDKSLDIPLGIYYKNNPYDYNGREYPIPPLPKLKINDIGNTYSYFEETAMTIVKDHFLTFTNLEKSQYDKILRPYNQINYIVNKDKWVSAKKEIGEMERWVSIFSKDGFNYPLCLSLDKNGSYYPIACKCKLLASYYLNLPTIPVCIIVSNEKIDYTNKIII